MTNNTDPLINSFLGRGWGFPPQFDKSGGRVRMVTEEVDICESLHILLSTRLGERLMRPNYGCNLNTLLFEPLSTQFISFVRTFVEQSITLHESRIELQKVSINAERQFDGLLEIEIAYLIRATNTPNNYVFPFYLEEANSLVPPIL